MQNTIRNIYIFKKYLNYLNTTPSSLILKSFDPSALQTSVELLQNLDNLHLKLLKQIQSNIQLYVKEHIEALYSTVNTKYSNSTNYINILTFIIKNPLINVAYLNKHIDGNIALNIIKLLSINFILFSIIKTAKTIKFARLPISISKYTVLRSPHVDKKAREQFELRKFKAIASVSYYQTLNIHSFINMQLPSGIGYLYKHSLKRF